MALKNALRTCLKINYTFSNLKSLHVHSQIGVINSLLGIPTKRSLHITSVLPKKKEIVTVIIQRGDQEIPLKGKTGESILDVVTTNELEISGYGACEGTLSCSTCHVKLSQEDFDRLPEKASDEEMDMLDLAPDVCPTSRLGCQIFLEKDLDGLKVKVPSVVKDMREFPGATPATT